MSTTIQDAPWTSVEIEVDSGNASRQPARRGPILLATDGTGRSGASVLAARLLAEKLDAPLEVVSVLEPQVIHAVALGGTPVFAPDVEDLRRDHRAAAVHDHVSRFSGGATPPSVHVRFGTIATEIAEVARQRSATLIVVGSAPHRRLNGIIAGERAVQVLRSSSVPVLSVPPTFSALPRNIVVAVDFSPASVRAAQTALLVLADGGTLTLLHVMAPLSGDAPLGDVGSRDSTNSVPTLFGKLRDELRPHVPRHVTIETRVCESDDLDGIVDAASRVGADLVAVGTHGPRLLERVVLGSVASSVLHGAPQAVLAAPCVANGRALCAAGHDPSPNDRA